MVEIGFFDGGLNKSLVHDSGLFLKYYDYGEDAAGALAFRGICNFGDGLYQPSRLA